MTGSPGEPEIPHQAPEENSRHGRLAFRPREPVAGSDETGLVELTRDDQHLGTAYVPPSVHDAPLRLVLLLHGAGGSARQGIDLLLPMADEHRLLLLAPKSRRATWDVIADSYGPDVDVIDALLEEVTARSPVGSLTVGGFSDGASYALSLGIANGDVFDSVVAFSPGFVAALLEHGSPRIFISHGSADAVLPVDRCSRRIVPQLRAGGYDVTYREFSGGHTVPAPIAAEAALWLEGNRSG